MVSLVLRIEFKAQVLGLYLAWGASFTDDTDGIRKAVGYMDKSIELFDDNAYVYYDRACTKNFYNDLFGDQGEGAYPLDEIIEDLEQVEGVISPAFARNDDDLKSLRGNPRFDAIFPPSEDDEED